MIESESVDYLISSLLDSENSVKDPENILKDSSVVCGTVVDNFEELF